MEKGKKFVAHTHISDKNKQKIKREAKERVKKIQKEPNFRNISNYNAYILGVHSYYGTATHVSLDPIV